MNATTATDNTESTALVLSTQQDEAYKQLVAFILDPAAREFILTGYAGVGKSTLMEHIVNQFFNIKRMMETISKDHPMKEMDLKMLASTHAAASNLEHIAGLPTSTVHSAMGLQLVTSPITGKQELAPNIPKFDEWKNKLVVIDEAGTLDESLLENINDHISETTKVLYIGDPKQLPPVGLNYCPFVYKQPRGVVDGSLIPRYELTQVMRQVEGNPIIALATEFRNAIDTGIMPMGNPLSNNIEYVGNKTKFAKRLVSDFEMHRANGTIAKVLGYTNKVVEGYNKTIRQQLHGNDALMAGDLAMVNKAFKLGKLMIRQQRVVKIIEKTPGKLYGVDGFFMRLDANAEVRGFMPESLAVAKIKLKERTKDLQTATDEEHKKQLLTVIDHMHNFMDLRDCYASTVHKAQGMTCHTVYIDLTDLSRYVDRKMLARLLYVALTRASDNVVFTGDI